MRPHPCPPVPFLQPGLRLAGGLGLVAALALAGCGGGGGSGSTAIQAVTAVATESTAVASVQPAAPVVAAGDAGTTLSARRLSWGAVPGASWYQTSLLTTGSGNGVLLPLTQQQDLHGSATVVRTPAWLAAGDRLVTSACNSVGCTAEAGTGQPVGVPVPGRWDAALVSPTWARSGLLVAAFDTYDVLPGTPLLLWQRSSGTEAWPARAGASLTAPASLAASGLAGRRSLSDDGSLLAVGSQAGEQVLALAIQPASGTAAWRSVPTSADPQLLALSGDGRTAATVESGQLRVYRLGDVTAAGWTAPAGVTVPVDGISRIDAIELSADGRWLVAAGRNAQSDTVFAYVSTQAPGSPQAQRIASAPAGAYGSTASVSMSADGQALAFGSRFAALDGVRIVLSDPVRCSAGSCRAPSVVPLQTATLSNSLFVRLSPDGRVLVAGTEDGGRAYVWTGLVWLQAASFTDALQTSTLPVAVGPDYSVALPLRDGAYKLY